MDPYIIEVFKPYFVWTIWINLVWPCLLFPLTVVSCIFEFWFLLFYFPPLRKNFLLLYFPPSKNFGFSCYIFPPLRIVIFFPLWELLYFPPSEKRLHCTPPPPSHWMTVFAAPPLAGFKSTQTKKTTNKIQQHNGKNWMK